MDFKKTDEQELLLEGLRELLAREYQESYIAECDRKHEFPVKFTKALLDNGFLTLGLPKEHGGSDADTLTQMLVIEEVAKTGAPAYICSGGSLCIDDMIGFGSPEQLKLTKEAFYSSGGRMPFSLAITEPQAGSDDSAITTTATRKNGKVYINGHKTFLTVAAESPYMLVVTRDLEGKDPHRSMSMWWVKGDAPGIKIEKLDKVGVWFTPTYEAYLENVEVEESDLIGKENEGFMQLMKNFEIERLGACATVVGYAQAAFDDAAKYANQRVQFGKPIGTNQLIQDKIVGMALKIENMRNLVYKTAWEKDNGISVQISSALAKYYCAKSAFEVVDDAMQIFGGIGYTNDLRIARLWRDTRAFRIMAGTDEIMVYIAGRAILKKHR
jgi:alkylation response protein AidB-like acyl-CoA dehydrogenase